MIARRILLVVLVTTSAGILLASCGQSAHANAVQACRFVERSLTVWTAAEHAPFPERTSLVAQATTLLEEAKPLANIAAGANGGYQPLAATLSEVPRVPERLLVRALRAECANPNANSTDRKSVV